MKRADQHPVSVGSLHADNFNPGMALPEETGLDSPSEKENPDPDNNQKPLMGELPVDIPGSAKQDSEWESSLGDESHESSTQNEKKTDDDPGEDTDENGIVHTGAGADPEHSD